MRSDRIPEAGALREWWRELATGARTALVADSLHLAACKEAEARDFDRLGISWIGDTLRIEAAEIVLQSAVAEAAL